MNKLATTTVRQHQMLHQALCKLQDSCCEIVVFAAVCR
jgi:hypothetical protein